MQNVLLVLLCALLGCSDLSATPTAERAAPLNERELARLDSMPSPGAPDPGGSWSQVYAMVGREDIAASLEQPRSRLCEPLMRNGAPADPLDEIVARAALAQMVIISEGHDKPRSRAFIAELSARLRPMGFSVYAAETLSESVSTRTAPYPSLRDGYYSREPIFGALLRRVRELEYTLVAYEHIPPSEDLTSEQIGAQREQGQAENLRERIFAATPSARVLVHAGYGHVYERGGVPGIGPMMAQRLKDISVDPLTIDQTAYVSPTDDFVVCDRPDRNYVDIEIGAPITTFEASRPVWRYRAGQRPMPVPSALAPTIEPVIIEARETGDPDDAVPVERLFLRPDERDVPLLLAPGRYRIEAWSPASGWSRAVSMTVR